jgi:S-formylglutathione hydrolase FrmB
MTTYHKTNWISLIALILLCLTQSTLLSAAESIGKDELFTSEILPLNGKNKWQVRYHIIFPKGFQETHPHSVVYFLHGRGGDRMVMENLGFLEKMDQWVNEHGEMSMIFVMPECHNCYWMNAALKDERWGEVITQELIRDVEKKYNVIPGSKARLIAGISMGGHGAVQLTLNYPGVFGALAAHSPVFRTQEEASRDFHHQFGEGDDFQNRDPFSLIQFKGKSILVPVWMDIGALDPAFNRTRNFVELLSKENVQGTYDIGNDPIGGHHGAYWSYHFFSYLNWYNKILSH